VKIVQQRNGDLVAQTTIGRREASAAREFVGLRRLPLEPLALLAIGAVALALRLWPLRHFSLDFQDEGAYWQSLKAMAAGYPLFSVAFSSQPPFFLLGLFPFYQLFGGTIVAARLGVALYSLLGLAAVYYIGRATAGRWAGLLACALLAVDPLYLAESRTLQAEAPSAGLALAGVALAAVAMGQAGAGRRWRAAASGVAIGLGVLTKLFDVAALVPAALYLAAPLFAALRGAEGRLPAPRRADIWRALRLAGPDLLLLGAGFVVACAAVLTPFLPVRELAYDQVVRFHQVAEHTNALGKTGWRANLGTIRDTVLSFYALPYLLLALTGVALAVWRRAWTLAPPLAWLAISLGLLVRQTPLIWHHVVLLAPLLAIVAGAALPLALTLHPQPLSLEGKGEHPALQPPLSRARESRVDRRRSRGATPQRSAGWRGEGLLAYALLVLVGVSALAGLWSSVEADRSRVDTNPPPAAVQRRMAAVLQDSTRPGEFVVTDGQYIAGLAGRSVPPELVDTSLVRIQVGQLDPRYFSLRRLEDIIARDRVRTILFATGRLGPTAHMPGFRPWVRRRYRLVARFGKDGELYQQ